MRPETRTRIALLIEGHVQYAFMTIEEIERFYARFYPRWNRDAYYGLMEKLKVAPRQRISRMSCGQRSQVALGLILAQNADLLVLDDFSDGARSRLSASVRGVSARLCPQRGEDDFPHVAHHSGHGKTRRRLHRHGLRAHSGPDAGRRTARNLSPLHLYAGGARIPEIPEFYNTAVVGAQAELYSFESPATVQGVLERAGVPCGDLQAETLNLEDAFIGLTGKY